MRHSLILVGVFAAWSIGTGEIQAQDQPVTPDQIPQAVMNALHAKFPNAKIDKASKANENNVIVYDLEFTQEGRKCEADIAENGNYINYEQAVQGKDLPKAGTDAIEKLYPKATLKEIMQETEVQGTKETHAGYEVVIVTAEKKELELRLSPDGKIVGDSAGSPPE
jgi:Putative beta-lactamase-inhibitor-like, PepSY-like